MFIPTDENHMHSNFMYSGVDNFALVTQRVSENRVLLRFENLRVP